MCLIRDALLRRSEVTALLWEGLQVEGDGTGRLTGRRSKTDQAEIGNVLYVSRPTMAILQQIRMDADGTDAMFGMASRTVFRRIAASAFSLSHR